MGEDELTPEEPELLHEYVELAPGLGYGSEDVVRAKLAKDAGGQYRKLAPGVYGIISGSRRYRS